MRRLVLVLVLLLAAAACAPAGEGDDRLRVVASFYPIAEAAERIGGDRVDVVNLTPAGAEPHDVELDTRSLDRVEDAALVLFLGGGFQPAVEEAAARAQNAVDLLRGVDLLPGETADPHVWLDPARFSVMAGRIGDALAAADPDGADGYAQRTREYRAELAALDADLRRGLARCERRLIVTSHAAFAYLADRYDLEQRAVSGISPEAEPDARRVSELIELVEREGVTTVYAETLASPRVARALARETGARMGVLDPLEGLSPEQVRDGADYASVMRGNLASLRDGLGCGS